MYADNTHVHPEIAARLHRYWPAVAPTSPDRLHAACQELGAAWREHEARKAAEQERWAAERRARALATRPPLPWHLSAKRLAATAQSLLRSPAAAGNWWARKNDSEQALRWALRAHIAQRPEGAAQ